MGYDTSFDGEFKLNKKLDEKTYTFLTKFAETRRMARNVGPEYGIEGEFYVDGKGDFGQEREDNVIDFNRPPKTQPGLWCQWVPSDDGKAILWDGNEKFYDYIEWIEYLIENILAPKGYKLTGEVCWEGESSEDFGKIVIKNNKVTVKNGKRVYN